MSKERPYVPSNGTEGMGFVETYCMNCINGKYEHTGDTNDNPCEVLTRSFMNAPDPIEEWVVGEDNRPKCKCFKKWDWGKDDDGNWIDPEPIYPEDPNQLCLPFIFEEIGIKNKKLQTA